MTVTVDSFDLKCQFLADDVVLIAGDWDEWFSGSATKSRRVYGAKGLWKFNLYETGVSWANSAAKYLRDKAKVGGTVVLAVAEGASFSLDSTTCYVLGCQTSFPLTGTVNKHFFTVTFREV
ncbi:hypothetical protein MUP79_06670 [Candidatus Bathyarchaeota archaeon]|nr:hypothetical protein [Candidatus Bathyarchaeota archaeon]